MILPDSEALWQSRAARGLHRAADARVSRPLSNPHDHPTALKDLQDAIYREKVLRARSMTPAERLDSIFELSAFQFGMMHAGAMSRLGTDDEEAGWDEVKRGLARLARARDHLLYVDQRPAAV